MVKGSPAAALLKVALSCAMPTLALPVSSALLTAPPLGRPDSALLVRMVLSIAFSGSTPPDWNSPASHWKAGPDRFGSFAATAPANSGLLRSAHDFGICSAGTFLVFTAIAVVLRLVGKYAPETGA